ncbi:Iron-sulfur binding electron transfer protein [Marinobacterium lacunae]|uniref:Iron-sulfur binding electron transfer protein n=2 Tax=Marinobacterium lacunae TaxID=1232683 RepID=A0A081G3J7_9GAMM|nr:Iron-sulfur binding electron transfer protein [Marinobacterium lacunae]
MASQATKAETYQISVHDGEAQFTASSTVNLLVAMEQARESVIGVGCRGGGCGKCRIRVLDGDYESKRMSRAWISEEDEAEGIVLACRIFARSDLCIRPEPLPLATGYQPARSVSLSQAELK